MEQLLECIKYIVGGKKNVAAANQQESEESRSEDTENEDQDDKDDEQDEEDEDEDQEEDMEVYSDPDNGNEGKTE